MTGDAKDTLFFENRKLYNGIPFLLKFSIKTFGSTFAFVS